VKNRKSSASFFAVAATYCFLSLRSYGLPFVESDLLRL
jgi:hypothetical protein